ncbi:MAG: SURF1-like protein [Acidimicrobiales bacterium]|nr:MAG: SURF1-like protein [Acidimicrobiales bacterium]
MSKTRRSEEPLPGARRWWLRPRWIASHLLVVTAVIVMVNLGFWQLRRHEQRSTSNAAIRERSRMPALEIDAGAGPLSTLDAREIEWRTVRLRGRYVLGETALVRGRSLEGSPGFWVLTPLAALGGDDAWVVVNRGWIPLGRRTDGSDVEWSTPSGVVEVWGRARAGRGSARPAGERITTLASPSLDWFRRRSSATVAGFYVELIRQEPPQRGRLPVPLPPPELTAGPHLSYAVQWFVLATIATVGYPLILRRIGIEQRAHLVAEEEPPLAVRRGAVPRDSPP